MQKTTVLMADEVIDAARSYAQERSTTLASVMETALIDYLARNKQNRQFKLRKKHSKKNGGMLVEDWKSIRDIVYDERETRQWKE